MIDKDSAPGTKVTAAPGWRVPAEAARRVMALEGSPYEERPGAWVAKVGGVDAPMPIAALDRAGAHAREGEIA